MLKSSFEERVKQRNNMINTGKIFASIGFPMFILALIASVLNSSLILVEEFIMMGMFCFSGGILFMALGQIIGWSNSPFWDFVFNQLGIWFVFVGFGYTFFIMMQADWDNGLSIGGLLLIFGGYALIGLGRRFHSTPIEQPQQNDKKSWNEWLDLQNPQVMKSVVGAIVWGLYGIIFAIFFKQPFILIVALIIGLLKGIDKQQSTLKANLIIVFKGTIVVTFFACLIGGIIGSLFVGLLFGANTAAFGTGLIFGIFAGLVIGAFMSLM